MVSPIATSGKLPVRTLPDDAQLREVADQFEAIFLGLLTKSMRTTVPEGGLMSGGSAGKIYESMLDQEYAKTLAQTRMTGISDIIVKQLRQLSRASEGKQQAGIATYRQQQLQDTAKQATMDGVVMLQK